MALVVNKVEPDDWRTLSSDAHRAVFGEMKDEDLDRLDYALLVATPDNILLGYITVRELDAKVVAWDFGGTFETARGSTLSWEAYKQCMDWTVDAGIEKIITHIENTNAVMLKFALKIGFIITGISTANGKVFCELQMDLLKKGEMKC